jgi:hypothetical protein
MGLQEGLMGLGVVVLLAALAYGATRASKRRRRDQAAADAASLLIFCTLDSRIWVSSLVARKGILNLTRNHRSGRGRLANALSEMARIRVSHFPRCQFYRFEFETSSSKRFAS